MSVNKMKRLSLAALRSDRDRLLRELVWLSSVEVSELDAASAFGSSSFLPAEHDGGDGRAALEDIGELFGMELPTDEFDTIGGLIFSAFDVIPEDGSRFSVSVCGIHADVDKVAEHRIVHCVIYKEEKQDAEGAPIAS